MRLKRRFEVKVEVKKRGAFAPMLFGRGRKLFGLRPLLFFALAECSVKNEKRNQLVIDTPKKSL